VTSYLVGDVVRQVLTFQHPFDKIAEDSLAVLILFGIGCQRVW